MRPQEHQLAFSEPVRPDHIGKGFAWGLGVTLQRELRCFNPLILMQPLLVFGDGLLRGGKPFLRSAVLRHRGGAGDNRKRSNQDQALTDRSKLTGDRLLPERACCVWLHENSPWSAPILKGIVRGSAQHSSLRCRHHAIEDAVRTIGRTEPGVAAQIIGSTSRDLGTDAAGR